MASTKLNIVLIVAFVVVLSVSVRDFTVMLATITENNYAVVVASIVLSVLLALYYKKQL